MPVLKNITQILNMKEVICCGHVLNQLIFTLVALHTGYFLALSIALKVLISFNAL